MINQSDCTIIIPHLGATKEQEYALDQCMSSLEESGWPGKQIIVVHNGVNDCKHTNDIEVLSQGQCKAVNAAVATVNTPWILVTNDDMIFPPGWFEKLVYEGIESLPLCVSPQLVEPRPGAPTFLTHFCGGAGGDFDKVKWLEFVNRHYKEVGYSSSLRPGFNLPFLMKKELWDLVGGYDVNYDPWGSNSDSDLEYKIKLAGVSMFQNRNCVVYHFSQTSGTFSPEHQDAWNKNWNYFIDKWGFPRTDEGIWEANFIMPDKERIYRPWWEGYYANR